VTEVAQGLVHHEEAILAAFLELPVAIAILDCDLRFVAVNEAMAVVNGLPPGEHVGRLATELLPGLDLATWDALRDVIATGRPKTFLVRGRTPTSPPSLRSYAFTGIAPPASTRALSYVAGSQEDGGSSQAACRT